MGLLWLAGMVCRCLCPSAWACTGQELSLGQAATLYSQRQDLSKAEQAAGLFRQVLHHDRNCQAAALGLVRASVYIGVLSSGDREREAYAEAAKAAQALLAQRPQHAEGFYWLGVAQALQANVEGLINALSLVREAQANLEAALKLDPAYDDGGAPRVLGRLYFKLPLLLGGDCQISERHLRQALELGPRYWLNHLYLAINLREQGRLEEARDLLRKIIAGPAGPGAEPEYLIWREQAQQLLREIGEK